MKQTAYFQYTRSRPDRLSIQDEWIVNVIEHPLCVEIQQDGRIKKWGWVAAESKYLRVILLADSETVHNAFFDRNFRED